KRLFDTYGLTISTYCAHANLLDPSAPWRYQTSQILKAVRAAATIGVKHIISTEGEPKTEFGHKLTETEALFLIKERLFEPLRMAEDLGVKILVEPHGKYSDSIGFMEKLFDACDSNALGFNMDTGNSWLGGTDPVEMVKKMGSRIEHVHWKDWAPEMKQLRGTKFGAGMSITPLGSGVVDIKGVFQELSKIGYEGYTTLEIAGDDAVKQSYAYLKSLGAE
ncbi:MAG TPA: sugar phosphate isomerase/epimerase family protein, partial [Spirochaetia bacterium]|nr:sugar phosphate isomerase/epimerase family protein [Spirochaetia bacterium]